MERIIANLEIKSVDDSKGTFVGYGAAFGNIDAGRDRIKPGAFDETMRMHKEAGSMPAMFWAHDGKEPIGEWKSWSTDSKGLLMEGQLWLGKGIPKAEQAYLLMKSNGPKGLSIGYKVPKEGASYDTKAQVRDLLNLHVGEVSPVPFPMNSKALITSVKNDSSFSFKHEDGSLKTIREIERLLRDAGLSDREAKALLSGGFAKMARRDGEDAAELMECISKFLTNPA